MVRKLQFAIVLGLFATSMLAQTRFELSTQVKGALPVSNGGTGSSTAAGSLVNLLPAGTQIGDILYCSAYASSACTTWSLLAGNTGSTGWLQETASGVPSWTSPSGSGNTTSSAMTSGTVPVATGTNAIGNSLITDNGTTLGYTGTGGFATAQQTTPDAMYLRPGSGATHPTYSQGWIGPAAPSAAQIGYQFPNAAPTAGQTMTFGAPSSGVSAISWGGPYAMAGTLLAVNVFTTGSGTTYTPPAGASSFLAVLVGAGGGGGGTTYSSSSYWANGGGGGAGSVCEYFVSGVAAGQTGLYTVSATGGTAGANTGGTGGTGASTTFAWNGGGTVTAPGGVGGVGEVYQSSAAMIAGGAGGAVCTGATVNGGGGDPGMWGYRVSGTVGASGRGGSTRYGTGGVGLTADGAGNAGVGYGAGGGGSVSHSAARAGGAGAPGVLIIYEYR